MELSTLTDEEKARSTTRDRVAILSQLGNVVTDLVDGEHTRYHILSRASFKYARPNDDKPPAYVSIAAAELAD